MNYDLDKFGLSKEELFARVDHSSLESEKITAPRYSYWHSVFRVFFKKKINIVILILLGIILLMLAVFSEVGHASLTKLLADGYKPQVIVMYQFLIGSVYFLPFFLTKGIESFDARLVSWEVLEPILALSVLCSSLAFSLWAMAIKRLGVAKSSVFLAMMCVATALIAEIIGREHLTILQWIGVFVAVLGIVLSQSCCSCKRKA